MSLRIVVANDGPEAVAGFSSIIRLASRDRYSGSDPIVGEFWTDVAGNRKRDRTQACTVPSETPPGEYRIAVKLDVRGDVEETNEVNNTFISSSTVTVRLPVVDIVAEEVEPSAGVFYIGEENPRALSARLLNLGPEAVGPFDYLVTLEPGAVKAAEGTVDGLLGDVPVQLNLSAPLEGSLAAGGYHLVLSADPLDVVPETNESNNVVASAVDVTVRRRLTDVYPTLVEVLQAEAPHGAELELRLRCACEGTDPAPPFECVVVLRKEPSGQEIVLGRVSFGALQPGGEVEMVVRFTLPWDSPSGGYYAVLIADPDDEIPETHECNNVLVSDSPVQLRHASFDVAVAAVCADEHEARPQDALSVTVTLENPAPDGSPGFDCSLYLSADEILSQDDVLLDRTSMTGLQAGQSRDEVFYVVLPESLCGSFYLIAFADPDDALQETDESNNVGVDPQALCVRGNKWAVIVGIAQYPSVDPPFADDDARQLFAKLLESDEYAPSRMTILIDAQATGAAVRWAVQTIGSQMEAGDTLVFFFSGEGWRMSDVPPYDEDDGYDEYICAYDAYDYVPGAKILDDDLRRWFTDYIPAGARVCVMIQGCRSGGMRNDFESLDNVVALLGCAETENCWSDYTLQSYGVFAYYTLEAFDTPSADANRDGMLSAEEIYSYAEPRTVEYLQGGGVSEHPQMVDCCDGELGVRRAQ